MFSGTQVSLYPMCDDYVAVILGAIDAIDPWREHLRIETDALSTLMVGPPEALFGAMRDLFCAAAGQGIHTTMHATVSRGCPGEPDDPICTPAAPQAAPPTDMQQRIDACRQAVAGAPRLNQPIAAQLSIYPLGLAHHMDEIYGCIEFLKTSGTFDRSKNFCTALRSDAGPLFETLAQAFTAFGAFGGHLAMDLTVSANSPSQS